MTASESVRPRVGREPATSALARRDLMVLLLAIAGGGVDAVIIIGFGVLTAAQTGNTILLVVAIARGQLTTGLHSAISILAYLIGVALGEVIIVGRRGSRWPGAMARTLVAEAVPLVGVLVAWLSMGNNPSGGASAILVTLAAVAMGVQSAAVLRLHVGPTTTYVTGTLTTFITEAVRRLRLIDADAPRAPGVQQPSGWSLLSGDRPWVYGITWIVYAAGALLTAVIFLRVGAGALAVPIAAVATALALAPRGS